MNLNELLTAIDIEPEYVQFDDVIETIDNEYAYSPSKFSIGQDDDMVINDAGANEGSCKILSFAILNSLTKEQTLNCFGKFYRKDVLLNPEGDDHANIRALMKYSLDDVFFYDTVLVKK